MFARRFGKRPMLRNWSVQSHIQAAAYTLEQLLQHQPSESDFGQSMLHEDAGANQVTQGGEIVRMR